MKARLLKELRKAAYRQIKATAYGNNAVVVWYKPFLHDLKYNVDRNDFFINDFTLIEGSIKTIEEVLKRARYRAIQLQVENYKEKELEKKLKKM